VKNLLRGHFISESACEYLLSDDFDNFEIERQKEIKRHVIDDIEIEEDA